MVALRMGRLDVAAESLRQAATLSPNDANILNSHGSVLAQTGQLDEAIELFQKATVLDPTFPMAWFNLGGSLLARGDLHNVGADACCGEGDNDQSNTTHHYYFLHG